MIGLLTPMANPTVEREMRRLLPDDLDYVVGRLVGNERNSTERLRAYAERLPDALAQFGGMPLAALAFACTAPSYLIGRDGEKRIGARMDLPVLWAARAIADWISVQGARRIAVVSPYPGPIHRAGLDYWSAAGLEVVADERVEIGSGDTRAIYALAAGDAVAAVERAVQSGADLVLVSGTGMPSLELVTPEGDPPVISSNHCLAQAMLAQKDRTP